MPALLMLLMLCLLLRAGVAMDAALEACRLFVVAVLPGLFPYMVLSLMLTSRLSSRLKPGLLMLLGWGGGSPTGARLLGFCPDWPRQLRLRLAVSCATMSPMFLLGTVGRWLGSEAAGAVVLISVLAGGWGAGWMTACLCRRDTPPVKRPVPPGEERLTFGGAVEQSARTMLLVCGTMVMLRVLAALAAEVAPGGWALPLTTLLEVTTGTAAIAALSLPLPLRTALIAGATGLGGVAIALQNRAVMGADALPMGLQFAGQALHGGLSFLIALGLMLLIC